VSLTVAIVNTAEDAVQLTITGSPSPYFDIDWQDGTAVERVDSDGLSTVVGHVYQRPGHHTYAITVQDYRPPAAATLQDLYELFPEDLLTPNQQSIEVSAAGWAAMANTTIARSTAQAHAGSASLLITSLALDVGLLPELPPGSGPTGIGITACRTDNPQFVDGVVGGQPHIVQAWFKAGNPNRVIVIQIDWFDSDNVFLGSAPTHQISTIPTAWTEWRQTVTPPAAATRCILYPYYSATVAGETQYMDDVHVWEATAAAPGTLATIATTFATLNDISKTSDIVTVLATVNVGPATIWATVVAGEPVPVIRLETYVRDAGDVLQWTVSRIAQGQPTSTIYLGTSTIYAITLFDYLAPLGVPVQYTLTVTHLDYSTDIVWSNVVTITGTVGCYLTNPYSGATLAVELQAWPSRARAPRRALLDVLSRPDPVALSDVHSTPAGAWTFVTRTDLATATLVELLTASSFAALRSQPGSSIASVMASVGAVVENRYSSHAGDPRRLVVVEVQEIANIPGTALPLASTLLGLSTLAGTLAELSELRQTLLQLSQITTGPAAVARAVNV
jgi:hypothetical protein